MLVPGIGGTPGTLGKDYSWWTPTIGGWMFQRANLAESLLFIVKSEGIDDAWGIARAITELNGIAPHVTPWANHCQLLIKEQWGDGSTLTVEWIEAWVVWFTAFVVEMEYLVVQNTGFRLGHGQFPEGYRVWPPNTLGV